jgi:HD-GYP domain-containing protein (c-di-GMP phosphodiesterase class II)
MAGLLHDIGKLTIPDEVLNKTGKLTDEEFEMIRQHPL